MKEVPAILKIENQMVVEMAFLSEDFPKNIDVRGNLKLREAEKNDREKIVRHLIKDVGNMFFKPENDKIRYDFISSMDSVEDVKLVYRAFVKKFGEDVVDES